MAVGGLFGATKPDPKKDDTQGGEGRVMVLDEKGRTVASQLFPAAVTDLDTNGDGTLFATGTFGTAALGPDLKKAIFTSSVGGTNARIAAGPEGGCVVLDYEGHITVLDRAGKTAQAFQIKGQHPEDIACDPQSGNLFVAGFDNKFGQVPGEKKNPVQVAWLESYSPSGERRWRSYGWGGQEVADRRLMADTRIYRLAFGADRKLYLAGESAGGNTIWSRQAHELDTPLDLVKGDQFQNAYNTGANHITAIVRLNPDTGDAEKATLLLARIGGTTSGKGNTIRPRSLAADAQGRVYVGGSSASNAPFSDGAFGLPDRGGAYFIQLDAAFQRTYATVLGGGTTRAIAVQNGRIALVGDVKDQLCTHQPAKNNVDPAGDGWLAVFEQASMTASGE